MSSSEGRVVLGGASGFMGRAVRAKYLAEGRAVRAGDGCSRSVTDARDVRLLRYGVRVHPPR